MSPRIARRVAIGAPCTAEITTSKAEAGRYTLAEAISYSHPNGPDGPRDGIDYMRDDEPAAPCLASVSSASAEPRALDWRLIAKAAGEHGVRYRTNTAMAKFLAAIASPEPVPATNQAGEVEQFKYYALPLVFHEAPVNGAAYIRDANGQSVAMMMWPGHPPEEEDAAEAEVYAIGRAFTAALATQPATLQEGEGTGWVAWNPDSGEEYTPNHPIDSGECVEAERIRRSTPQEDTLWQGMQEQFMRAEALAASHAAILSEDLRAKCSICAGNSFVAVDVMQFDKTFAPGPERRCVECKTTFTAQAFAALAATPTPPTLSVDVTALVIAAREFWDDNNDSTPESDALDKALELFSARVPYGNEPALAQGQAS